MVQDAPAVAESRSGEDAVADTDNRQCTERAQEVLEYPAALGHRRIIVNSANQLGNAT